MKDELFEESIKITFAKRMKIARKKMGITQIQLARILGVNDRDISKYETRRNFPKVVKIVEIAIALNVSIDYLLGLKDEMK